MRDYRSDKVLEPREILQLVIYRLESNRRGILKIIKSNKIIIVKKH